MQEIIVHTDGASRGNPGPAAIGVVIEGLGDKIEIGEKLGIQSNNFAEYTAMIRALELLVDENLKGAVINCFADSELMIRQLNGIYKVKNPQIQILFGRVDRARRTLEARGCVVNFTHVLRENNKEADNLGNEALDGLR